MKVMVGPRLDKVHAQNGLVTCERRHLVAKTPKAADLSLLHSIMKIYKQSSMTSRKC